MTISCSVQSEETKTQINRYLTATDHGFRKLVSRTHKLVTTLFFFIVLSFLNEKGYQLLTFTFKCTSIYSSSTVILQNNLCIPVCY